ncbi:MAG: hypothetical protein IJZ77_06315 [Bacilli bacterium]|nr:hypothetical protein [Bacilli bacterium]MBQ8473190.1 hypothetical protein [Bacilli bacterium]
MDGKLRIDTELETKNFEAQLNELKSKLQVMQKTLLTENEIPVKYRMSESERMALESSIERTKNQIIDLEQKISNAGDESESTGKKMSINFEKGVRSLKRFGLSLFSLRSIYSLVSKASSAYLSQNTELAQKLQNVWVGLGSFLSPVIEYLSDVLMKGLGYLNVFIKALTGTDFIANANAKALDKQAKAQANLNKQTASFDEINKVSDTSSSGTSDLNLIETPELDDKMVKKLEDLANWLIENRELIKDVGIALGVTFGAVKIAGLLSNISKLIGSAGTTTGLIGIKVGLMAIAAALATKWAVDNWIDLKNGIDNTKASLDDMNNRYTEGTRSAQKYSDKMWGIVESGKATEEVYGSFKRSLNETNDDFKSHIKTLQDGKNWLGQITGTNQQLTESQAEVSRALSVATADFIKLKEEGKVTDVELQEFCNTLANNIRYLEECGVNALDLKEDYETLTGKKYETTVSAQLKDDVTWKFKNLINSLTGMNIYVGTTFHESSSGRTHGGNGRAFAKGDIVYQPTRALIGEAGYPEAIVPMTPDYLSVLASEISRYGNNGGPSVTNVYLDGKLIQRQFSKKQEIYDFSTNN